jgi:hypothetical protein
MRNLFFIPCLRHIKITVTTAKFSDISGTIVTRANNVFIPIGVFSGQPAGAGHVAVPFFVGQQSF